MLPLDELVAEHRAHLEWDWPPEEEKEQKGLLPFARRPGDTWSGWYVDQPYRTGSGSGHVAQSARMASVRRP